MPFYQAADVKAVCELHASTLKKDLQTLTVRHQLGLFAQTLWKAYEANDPRAGIEISNYHPRYLGKSWAEIKTAKINCEDCERTIAREYGYADWHTVEELHDLPPDIHFQHALDIMLSDDLEQLEQLLTEHPKLARQRSVYGHKATLLHYLGANGIEIWRQQVPSRASELAVLLMDMGADKRATMKAYGGRYDAFCLLTSSTHPKAAGVGDTLAVLLR